MINKALITISVLLLLNTICKSGEGEKAILNGLLDAIKDDDRIAFSRLLRDVEDVNTLKYNEYGSPLNYAVWWERNDMVLMLLKRGLSPEIKCNMGLSALHWASGNKFNPDMVTLLMEAGANPYYSVGGFTPIMNAARYENILKAFIKSGVDVNYRSKDTNGKTALMWAAEVGNKQSVELLLEAGASVIPVDDQGKTAIDYAVMKGHNGIADQLQRRLRKEESGDLQTQEEEVSD